MLKILLFLVIFLIISSFVSAARINEIMYNPEGNDNNQEFIEIYSSERLNLSDFIIGDMVSNDSLELLSYHDSDYYLIVEEGFNYSGIEASVYSAGATIGNNLNTEDFLFLYHNNTIVDNISYSDKCEIGHSLEYFNSSFLCSFYLGGTPGKVNSNKNQDYSSIVINELFVDPAGDDNAAMPDGEFIELYNPGAEEIDMKGSYFSDISNHRLYVADTNTFDGTVIGVGEYLAVYANGFSGLLNNDEFEEIELYDPYGNLINKVNYGNSKEDLSWSLVDGVWQLGLATPGEENPEEEPEMDSYFEIEDIDGGSNVEFGDIIKVKVNVYKGDTNKESIKVYIEDDEDRISKITKADLPDKFTHYSFTLPIQVYSNCKGNYDGDDYEIRLGWTYNSDAEDSFPIEVKGNNADVCDKIYVEKTPRKGTLEYNLAECPGVVRVGEEFISKIELVNNDDEDHIVDLHSYVYRGSKCYSGEREGNLKKVMVKAGDSKEFELNNIVDEAKEGEYKLKIKVKRDDQKTTKEITEDIKLLAAPIEIREESLAVTLDMEEEDSEVGAEYIFDNLSCGSQVKLMYESTGIKSRNMVPYFIIVCLTALCVFLIVKKID